MVLTSMWYRFVFDIITVILIQIVGQLSQTNHAALSIK